MDDHLSDPLLNSYLQLTLRLAERLEEHATILSEAVERVSATDASPESVGAYVARAECAASSKAAYEAYVMCARDDCFEVSLHLDDLSFVCSGSCDGTCPAGGSCSGTRLCTEEIEGEVCEGTCEGGCVSDEPFACRGHCIGECTGECSAFDATGHCNGYCEGECQGACAPDHPEVCAGACFGICNVESATCFSDRKCQGQCGGICEGECQGIFLIESETDCASFRCEDLGAAASALEITCSQPSVVVWKRDAIAPGDAPLSPNIGALQADFAIIAREKALLQAFLEGTVNEETIYDPVIVKLVVDPVTAILDEGVGSELFRDTPMDELHCVVPTLYRAISRVQEASWDALSALDQGLEFVEAYGLRPDPDD